MSLRPVTVAGVEFGGPRPVLIAGPCAVEDEEMLDRCARAAVSAGASMLRGGAFKPRTSPYKFQGLGLEGLRMLASVRSSLGIPVVSEVMSADMIGPVSEAADMLQVGSRNMHNSALLTELGRCGRPVLLKRGFMATIEEWLLAAEYLINEGNDRVVLCERGIRTIEPWTRNTLDLAAIVIARRKAGFPVIADPCHAAGRRDLVEPLSKACLAAGADGLMIEIHPDPARALSDGDQSLDLEAFSKLAAEMRPAGGWA